MKGVFWTVEGTSKISGPWRLGCGRVTSWGSSSSQREVRAKKKKSKARWARGRSNNHHQSRQQLFINPIEGGAEPISGSQITNHFLERNLDFPHRFLYSADRGKKMLVWTSHTDKALNRWAPQKVTSTPMKPLQFKHLIWNFRNQRNKWRQRGKVFTPTITKFCFVFSPQFKLSSLNFWKLNKALGCREINKSNSFGWCWVIPAKEYDM